MAYGIWDTTRNTWLTMTWHRERVPMLFDRFFTADDACKVQGKGFQVREYNDNAD